MLQDSAITFDYLKELKNIDNKYEEIVKICDGKEKSL
jgi:hypothetical protein